MEAVGATRRTKAPMKDCGGANGKNASALRRSILAANEGHRHTLHPCDVNGQFTLLAQQSVRLGRRAFSPFALNLPSEFGFIGQDT